MPKPEKERVWIFVDNQYCCSIRARTFSAMNLKVGDEISCQQIQENEKFHWKKVYGVPAWEKEKIRLQKVKTLLESFDDRIAIKIIGFGADTNEMIAEHPKEPGSPDLEVILQNDPTIPLMFIEVSGTEIMRGQNYWIRPDKLAFSEKHPESNVWIVLHYSSPTEKFIFIKPIANKKYLRSEKFIRGSKEYYVEFNDQSEEVFNLQEFNRQLKKLILSKP